MDRRRHRGPHVYRTWQQLIVVLVVAVVPETALAYHNGSVYDKAPGAGGGGGLFYVGSKRERGWDCTACHIDPRGALRVNVTSQPSELIAQLRYQPNTTYAITVAMAEPGQQLGLASTRSNYNAMVISMLDDAGNGAGTISAFDPGRFYARGTSILASDSTTVNETSWQLSWTAPATAAGPITINLGVVDGNGANTPSMTLTDPLGDDTVMTAFVVSDTAAARSIVWWTDVLIYGSMAPLIALSAATTFSIASLESPNNIFVTGL